MVPKGGFYLDAIALCRISRLVLFHSEFYGTTWCLVPSFLSGGAEFVAKMWPIYAPEPLTHFLNRYAGGFVSLRGLKDS